MTVTFGCLPRYPEKDYLLFDFYLQSLIECGKTFFFFFAKITDDMALNLDLTACIVCLRKMSTRVPHMISVSL